MVSLIQRLRLRRQKQKPVEPKNEVYPMPESEDPSPLPHPTPITTHLHAVHTGHMVRNHIPRRQPPVKRRRGIVMEPNHRLLQPSREWVYPITYR